MTVEGPRGPALEFVDDDDASRARARATGRRRLLASLGLVALCSGVVSSVTVAGQRSLTGAETSWVRTPRQERPDHGIDAPPTSDVTGAEHGRSGDSGRDKGAWSTDTDDATPTASTVPTPAPPAIVARPIPEATPNEPPPGGPPPPWADSTTRTDAGYLATEVGCAAGTSAPALDAFFRERIGPVVGHDYQHVYPLGGDRSLWIFQDTFIDHTGRAVRLDQSAFAHNTAMLQDGACFTLLHRGTAEMPESFEPGTGERRLRTWFWPMGGELANGRLQVFWAEMAKRPDPGPPHGLGWDPVRTWIATYDAGSLARTEFGPAPNDGVTPIFGYAVSSDDTHSYLFGNTFDQRLSDQGGFFGGPHSARLMFLARVPRGQLSAAPEYWDGRGWTAAAGRAVAISDRFSPENPMQPRYLGGQWVAVTKAGGYWGEELAIDVAHAPQGPWLTVSKRHLPPRGGDPKMNTYHAHLMPWLADGMLVVSVSQNARNMLRDAWPHPARYRLQFLSGPLVHPDDAPPQAPLPTWPTTPPPPPPTPPTTRPTTPTTPTTPPTTPTTPPTTPTTPPTTPTTEDPPSTSTDPPLRAPTASAIDPAAGPASGGNRVTVSGTGFLPGATSIRITPTGGGEVITVPPHHVDADATTASFTMPASATAGAAWVVVSTAGGLSAPLTYHFLPPPPTAATIDPMSGPLTGLATVTVTGSGFVAGATTVTVVGPGGADPVTLPASEVTVGENGSSATFAIPASTAPGDADVTLATPGGITGALTFTYLPAPTAETIDPASGPLAGGGIITVHGTGFVAGSTSIVVTPPGAADPVTIAADVDLAGTTATFVAPASPAPGVTTVMVVTPGGADSLDYQYLAP